MKDLPPLHGLPISIKDMIPTKYYIDTCGYASQLFNK